MEEDEWDDALLSEIAALETRHLETHNCEKALNKSWTCRSCTLQNETKNAVCQVCSTPRGQSYSASTIEVNKGRKTVQATLSFDARASQQRQQAPYDERRVETLAFREKSATMKKSQQTTLATDAGCILTSRRSSWSLSRHARGEDSQAKTRYLSIESHASAPEIDAEACQHFVYPTNYSIREYQLTIAEKALYHNTLVSLPTGLGKTLIAAVVMYNFYRWFPTGKIVFLAPTKPLVAQQIQACHEIMGIPLADTAELQGNVPPPMRRVLWKSRRVFFCTPQSLQNDLRRKVCAAEKFVCIVVDEAHRATGNYAYCCVVQAIEAKTRFFRVLALSATPGAKFDVIQEVVTNLRISHIESRSADDSDVNKYTHARQEEVVVCHLGAQIMQVKRQLLKCFRPIVERLFQGQIIQHTDPEKLTSWYVLQAREKFRKSPTYASHRSAESDLALLVSLLHAKSLLTGHGLSSFREQIQSWVNERKKGKMSWAKREMLQSSDFEALESSLALTGDSSSSAASHPKLVKLRQVLLEHFQRHAAGNSSTRAIVFTQYRASVAEIVTLLRPLAPLVKVQPFVGQGASGKAKENKGQSQKVQQEIVQRFRIGDFNVLVATCIAEEGLDIGEVDLIVSFDALTSPVRMIQRMGRTGRKRVGKVVILVTEGEEQKKLARSASAAKTVSRALTTFKSRFTYCSSPRMLPNGVCPQLRELRMKIPTFHASQVGGKSASGAVDPHLWQLSDAERAVAMMKYFPPQFAASWRNKLHPIVANSTHLLRQHLHDSTRTRTRGKYGARSLMLQALVRKIHKCEDDDETDAVDSSSVALVSTSRKDDGSSCGLSCLNGDRRGLDASTNNAETDGDVGSVWQLVRTPRKNRSEGSFDESSAAFDMNYSPQFVDGATQVVSAVEEGGDPRPASVEKEVLKTSVRLWPNNGHGRTHEAKDDTLSRSPQALEAPRIELSDVSSEDKCQQVSAALTPTPVVSRLRSTRQLRFDGDESDGKLLDGTHSTDPHEPNEELQGNSLPQTRDVCEDRIEDSFGLSPTKTTTKEVIDVVSDEDQAEEESLAYSFALLPPIDTGNGGTISRDAVAVKVTDDREEECQAVEDDEVVGVNEGKVGSNDDSTRKTHRAASVVDVAPKERASHAVAKGEAKAEAQDHVLVSKSFASGANDAIPIREDAKVEQVEDDRCSVCLESESYDDDPIVFCDGCNVAVHQFCYGISVIPRDKWFCDSCQESQSHGSTARPRPRMCHLCPLRGGAFKQTKCAKWVHVQCFVWIPELQVERKEDDVLVLGPLSGLDPDRKTLDCSLCHSKRGDGIIQCAYRSCLAAFHVSCAAFAHYRMDQMEPSDDAVCGTLFRAYCPLHSNAQAHALSPPEHKTSSSTTSSSSKTAPQSPSHLIASPSSAERKEKFKTFRRLKRKYDATPSQGEAKNSLQWHKRLKRRRETSRVLAAAYIEDLADVQGGAQRDDDDDDDYGDDEREAADDSFINDSSQLLYSQSVVSPEDTEHNKKRKRFSPDMRAIYARSLFESQSSPLFLRRGGALPSNGIIRACLTELHKESNGESALAMSTRSGPRVRDTAHDVLASKALENAATAVSEYEEDDGGSEAEPLPSFSLLQSPQVRTRDGREQEERADTAEGLPSSTAKAFTGDASANLVVDASALSVNSLQDDEVHKKIEANRMKALKKLEERRRMTSHQAQPQSAASLSNNGHKTSSFDRVELNPPPERRLPSVTSIDITSSKLMKPRVIQQDRSPKWEILVSSTFASSSAFSTFQSTKHIGCSIIIDEKLEADALLSVRMALVLLPVQHLSLTSPPQNVIKSRRLGTLLAMHKKVVIAVVHDNDNVPELLRLRQLSNATVLVQPRLDSLCVQLHRLAHDELVQGYELPSPSLCHSALSQGTVKELDAEFASRLAFFRTIPPLSLDSALSLSFRFKNFTADQVPVLKFNDMHWRRMLPWISESTAQDIRKHIERDVR